jgi:hypothetical protein
MLTSPLEFPPFLSTPTFQLYPERNITIEDIGLLEFWSEEIGDGVIVILDGMEWTWGWHLWFIYDW